MQLGSVHVSESCFENKGICLQIISGMNKKPRVEGAFIGEPAANFCEQNGGVTYVLVDSVGNQYTYCKVGINFFIDSWDLYFKKQKQWEK